jgi:hypothetical protein
MTFSGPGRLVFVSCLGLLFLLPVIAGCGPGHGKVSGRVLLNGEPLPGGLVTFRPADPRQNSVSARLDGQGNYEAVLPVGEVKVSFDNRELEPRAPRVGGMPKDLPLSPEVRKALGGGKSDAPQTKPGENAPEKPSGRYVKVPDKYYGSETSGLQFSVGPGDQKHDIELTK